MNSQPRTRTRSARRVHALVIAATTILLWGAAWVALGIAAISEVGA